MRSIVSLLKIAAEEDGDRSFLVDPSGRAWTYKELLSYSNQIAKFLQLYRTKTKEHVGLYFNNNADFVASFFGVLMAECIPVPIPYNSKDQEIHHICKMGDISFCLANEPVPSSIQVLNIASIDDVDLPHDEPECMDERSETGMALLFPTSGSTGNPKLVMLSNENVVTNAAAHSEALSLTAEDRFMLTMPIYFSSSITTQLLSCLITRTPLILFNNPFIPKKVLKVVTEREITCLALVPTTLMLLTHSLEKQRNQTIGTVKTIVVSGSPLHKELYERAQFYFPHAKILQTYGLSEAAPRVSIMSRLDSELSCGKPVRGVEVKIVDQHKGVECANLETGEIYVKGPNVMLGYYNNPTATDQTIHNGWLATGDIGYKDHFSNLYVVGRRKNVILVGGTNVYPEEIEEALTRIEEVEEAAVSDVEDELMGQIPVAVIVFKEDKWLSEDELFQVLKDQLSNYKMPRAWLIIDNLPRTSTGKINRNSLRDLCKAKVEMYQSQD